MNTDPRRAALFCWFDGTAVDARLLAGLLGYLDAIDPLRQPGMVTVDTNDEALAESIENIIRGAMLPVATGGFSAIEVHGSGAARALLAALAGRGEQP